LGRLKREKLTESAKSQLQEVIATIVQKNEEKFIKFFNKALAINKRLHQIELLPGLGKKHMQEILKQRDVEEFKSFADMKERVANLPDPEKAIEKRIFQELTNIERYNLFTQ
jgi:putative nucleotide binding protein